MLAWIEGIALKRRCRWYSRGSGLRSGTAPSAGFGGFDDRVYVAAFGGNEWVCEAFPEFGDFFPAQFFAIGFGSSIEFAFVDDVDGAFRAHYSYFRHGPGKVCVGANVFRSHDAIRAAVGLARDDGDFRHSGVRESVQQFFAVADDAAEPLRVAGKKPWASLEIDKRIIEGIQ